MNNTVVTLAKEIKASDARSLEFSRQRKNVANKEEAEKQRSKRLRETLLNLMENNNLKEAHGSGLLIKLRLNSYSATPLVDIEDLPEKYKRVKVEPDLMALRKDLKKQKPEAMKVARLECKPYVSISEKEIGI